jgi:hypothetical protein
MGPNGETLGQIFQLEAYQPDGEVKWTVNYNVKTQSIKV